MFILLQILFGCYKVIIFQQQTPIMFKKKHSEINIKVPLRPYSPLRNKSPVPMQPSPRNLSPMKNTFRNLQSRTPRKQLALDQQPRSVSPRNYQNHFSPQLQSYSNYNEPRHDSAHRFPINKCGFRNDITNDISYFSNYSNISKDNNNNQTMKQSKRLFTKCIAEMNSQKRKVCAQRSNNSNTTSVVQNSKQVTSDSKMKNIEPGPVTSFKALKIQMIESVLPPEKKYNTIDRKNTENENYGGRQYKTKEFMIQQPKKEQIIELINQSFSNAGVSRIAEYPQAQKKVGPLEAKAKVLESLYVEQESDYNDFDLIMQKVQIQPSRLKMQEVQQNVKMSMQSERASLTMDPFY